MEQEQQVAELELDTSWVEGVLRKEDSLHIARVLEVTARPGVAKYNNYASDVIRLQLRLQLDSGEETSRSVILKKALEGRAAEEIMGPLDVYQTEILVYSYILKEMDKLLDGQKEEEKIWAKYYGSHGNNILLEDLKELGYRLTDKHTEQDYNHAELVMKALGKFHALSMVLVERGLFDPDKLSSSVFFQDLPFMNKIYHNAVDDLVQSIPSWGPEWQEFPALLRTAVTDVGRKLKSLWEEKRSEYSVINHGDCWSNNMMFRYLEGDTPVSVRLLDLQICHYNSLGWDLNYYLHSTTYPDSRKRYLTPLLEAYTASLAQTCSKLHYQGHVYTLTEVQDALHQLRYFGFLTAISHIPIHISSAKEDFDFNVENFLDDKPQTTKYCESEKVINVLKTILLEFKDHGII